MEPTCDPAYLAVAAGADPAILAIAEATRYDIWGSAVIAQVTYSGACDPTGLLIPLDEARAGGNQSQPDWKIELTLPSVESAKPVVTTSGALRPVDAGSLQAMLGRAALVASQHLEAWRGRLCCPVIVRPRKIPDGYQVSFALLPEDLGEEATVLLSEDLKWYRVVPDPPATGLGWRRALIAAERGDGTPVGETGGLVAQALAAAFEYDIYDSGVVIQTVYSSIKEPTVLFAPLHESREGAEQLQSDWRIEVRPSHPAGAGTAVTATGPLARLDPNSPKWKLHEAVMVGSRRLGFVGSYVSPNTFGVTEFSDGYSVSYARLPFVVGGHRSIHLSRDLKQYQISGGR